MYLEELKVLINRYENGIITLEQAKANILLLDSRGNQDVYSCDYFAVRHIISKLSRLIAENQNEDFVSVMKKTSDIFAGRENAYFSSYCGINWRWIEVFDSKFEWHCNRYSEVLRLKKIIAKIRNDSEPDEDEILFINEFSHLETGVNNNAVNIILSKIKYLWNVNFGNSCFDGTFKITPVIQNKLTSDINEKLLDEYIECYLGNREFLAEVMYVDGNPQVSFTALLY